VRKQSPGVAYFEIDDLNTLSFKKARLAENGIVAAATFIPGDYVADDFLRLLATNGFRFDLPTYVIWEGNTMYLTGASAIKVLAELRQRISQFRISFDYMAEEVIAHATGDRRTSVFVERFAAMGAPWHFGVNDLEALAEEADMTIVDNVRTAELHRRYWPGRPLDATIYEYYSLCTLKPASAK
jgi:O-methyltransferase involved in polyketide biosynthesis